MKRIVLGVVASLCLAGTAHAKKACEGIFPKNDAWIGANIVNQGITQQEFDAVLDRVVKIYEPIVASHGAKLEFKRKWSDGTVNADTYKSGGKWIVNAYGGLARYNGMTMDGYAGVSCHELGHHLGGAPLYSGDDMSTEGQADYHMATKCLRRYFAEDDNVRIMSGVPIDPTVVSKCTVAFVGDNEQIALCERAAMAGFVIADILRDLGQEPAIAFNTPDPSVVKSTYESHPAAQCRLDTYLESAVCPVSYTVDFSMTDVTVGACMTGDGARSACWFKP